MNKKLKHNLTGIIVYTVIIYVLLIPFKMWVIGISISLIIGLLFGFLDNIITELRKLNGEKFPNLED
jgi:hypothetical protein